jgi:hypothetical protein
MAPVVGERVCLPTLTSRFIFQPPPLQFPALPLGSSGHEAEARPRVRADTHSKVSWLHGMPSSPTRYYFIGYSVQASR